MSKEMREQIDRVKNLSINEDFNGNETDIEILYKNHPELSKIGTPEQYSNYIKSIFPSSGVKNIVYHDTRSERIEGGKLRPSNVGAYGEGIYVQTRRELTGVFGPKTLFLVINTKKAFPYHNLGIEQTNPYWNKIREKHRATKKYHWVENAKAEFKEYVIDLGFDALKTDEGGGNVYYILFEPEQTHILGTEEDMKAFSNFVGSRN
jgi:hypothetical protein